MTRTSDSRVGVALWPVAVSLIVYLQRPRWLLARGKFRSLRSGGHRRWPAAEAALAGAYGRRTARLVLHEPRLLWGLALLLRRTYDGAPTPKFSSHRTALPVWVLLTFLAALEIGITPLLPLPAWAHAFLLVAGVWTLGMLLALVASLVAHPHLLTDEDVSFRFGFWDTVDVRRSTITLARRTTSTAARGLSAKSGCASLTPTGDLNVEIHLSSPVIVRGQRCTVLRIWADEPDNLLNALSSPRNQA